MICGRNLLKVMEKKTKNMKLFVVILLTDETEFF